MEKFTEYLTKYSNARKNAVAARTYEAECRYIRLYIAPIVGNMRLIRVTAHAINAILSPIVEAGHTRTAQAVYTYLKTASANCGSFRHAMQRVSRPKHRPKSIQYFGIAEAQRLLIGADPVWKPVYLTILLLGLRRGEVAGLRWQDIDDQRGIIHICNQRQYIQGKGIIDCPPKSSAGVRDLPLLPAIETTLQPLYTLHQIGASKSPYVFGGIVPSSINHALKRDCEVLSLPPISVHGLRHTFATMAITNNQSIRVLQTVLGHSDITTTSKIYAHVEHAPQQILCDSIAQTLFTTRRAPDS